MPVAAGMYYIASELGPPGSLPLILIHGAGGSYLGWHNRIRRMQGVNVYSLDLPGHGKSSGEGRQSVQAYARDVFNFMQEIGLYHAALAGHSLGGMIALQIASQQPDQIQKLILVSSSAYCPIPENVIQGLLNSLTGSQSMDWLVDRLSGGSGSKKWVEATRQAIEQTRRGVLYGDLMACHSADLTGELENIKALTLVCYGDQDRFFSPLASLQLGRQIFNSEVRVFTDAGHLLPLERPDELADTISSFLY